MSDSNNSSRNALPGLILLGAVLAGVAFVLPNLISSRPSSASGVPDVVIGDEVVPALPWQDPFEAVTRFEKAKKESDSHSIANLASQVRRITTNGSNVRVLMVMSSGGPYGEDAESRLRQRYAIQAALTTAGYKPIDPEHINFFWLEWSRRAENLLVNASFVDWDADSDNSEEESDDAGGRNDETAKFFIPYEWFESMSSSGASRSNEKTLVWWLNESAFADAPLIRLAQLKQFFNQNYDISGNSAEVHFSVLGPQSSGTLGGILDQLPQAANQTLYGPVSVLDAVKEMQFFCANATAPTDWLVSKDAIRSQPTKGFIETNLFRLHATDDDLTDELIDELERRGIRLGDKSAPQVALITEWDTRYGRTLPRIFAEKTHLLRMADDVNGSEKAADAIRTRVKGAAPDWPRGVQVYSYLRGMDGLLPGDANKTAGKSGNKPEAQAPMSGPGQLDYMRRLAARLRKDDAAFRRRGEPGFRAIGVLGSDVYDKLVVLQALCPLFPNAVFFTTDLDSRLLHASELEWTRNLVVASGFGLELHEKFQQSIPPFRDTYQAAQYIACLKAVNYNGHRFSDGSTTSSKIFKAPHPRVFEVGKNGAWDITVPSGAEEAQLIDIHPQGTNAASAGLTLSAKIMWLVVFFIMGLVLLAQFSTRAVSFFVWLSRELNDAAILVRRRPKLFLRKAVRVAGLLLLFGSPLLILISMAILSEQPAEEPFSLLAGISVWPTQIIRLLVICLCLGFLVVIRHWLRSSRQEVVREFLLPARAKGLNAIRDWRRKFDGKIAEEDRDGKRPGFLQRFWAHQYSLSITGWGTRSEESMAIGSAGSDHTESVVSGESLWNHYNILGHPYSRVSRVLPNVIIYCVICVMILRIFGDPLSPVRGDYSRCMDTLLQFFSILLQIVLTFVVLDATHLCKRLIDKISVNHVQWPKASLDSFRRRFGMDELSLRVWIGFQIIAARSRVVNKLIYFPFITLFLTIISRNKFFDSWSWALSLVIILGINSAFALGAVFFLRKAAIGAKSRAVAHLREFQVALLGDPKRMAAAGSEAAPTGNSRQVGELIDEIEGHREGIFAPLRNQPVIRAFLMPFGGAGVLLAMEFFGG